MTLHKGMHIVFIVLILIAGFVAAEVIIANLSLHALKQGATPIEVFLPKPSSVIGAYIENFSHLNEDLFYTLYRSMVGLALGALLAISISFVAFLSTSFDRVATPALQAINAFPIVGFAPLLILIFGQGSDSGIIFLSMLLSYFPIYVSISHAIRNTPKGIQEIAIALGASKYKDFIVIRMSEMKGALISSLRLAFPASVIGATVGEWLGTGRGIGQLVTVSLYRFEPEIMYAALSTLIIVNLLALWLIIRLERKVAPWA